MSIWCSCQDALGAYFSIYLDSLESTINSSLINVPVSHISMEVFEWMEETITIPAQVVDSKGHTILMPHCQSLVTVT